MMPLRRDTPYASVISERSMMLRCLLSAMRRVLTDSAILRQCRDVLAALLRMRRARCAGSQSGMMRVVYADERASAARVFRDGAMPLR